MPKTAIDAPPIKGVGPYSLAIASGDLVFCSGQTPLDPTTGKLAVGDMSVQTRQCLENIKHVLASASLTFSHVVKTTVFLTDMGDFAAMNAVYATYFPAPFPARSTVAVAALPLGARVEIEVTADRKAG